MIEFRAHEPTPTEMKDALNNYISGITERQKARAESLSLPLTYKQVLEAWERGRITGDSSVLLKGMPVPITEYETIESNETNG